MEREIRVPPLLLLLLLLLLFLVLLWLNECCRLSEQYHSDWNLTLGLRNSPFSPVVRMEPLG